MQHQDFNLAEIAAQAVQKAGGAAALGRALRLPKQTVHSWKSSRIPSEWMPRVAALTGMEMSALRPDLFDAPQPVAAE